MVLVDFSVGDSINLGKVVVVGLSMGESIKLGKALQLGTVGEGGLWMVVVMACHGCHGGFGGRMMGCKNTMIDGVSRLNLTERTC